MFDIWNHKEELALKIYKTNNYKIIKNSLSKKKCVVYFSSNNIWYPNTKEEFIERLVKKDRFEWMKTRVKDADKEIFIRDIYKSWYVTGINEEINCIDKLIDFLKKEIEGYEKVISIGSSAGGYIAALVAAKLNFSYSICFSAQYDLYDKRIINVNPFLQKYKNDLNKEKYFNICGLIKNSNVNIYYFIPSKSKWDILQMKKVMNINNINKIMFKSKRHGIPLLKCNLEWLINLEENEIKNIFVKNKIFNPIKFSINLIGLNETLKYLIKELLKIIKRRDRYKK